MNGSKTPKADSGVSNKNYRHDESSVRRQLSNSNDVALRAY
jgi:hypothetical protein